MFNAKQTVNMTSVEAVVIRADGRVEDLGTLSYWHANPLRRWAWALGQFIRGRKPGRINLK